MSLQPEPITKDGGEKHIIVNIYDFSSTFQYGNLFIFYCIVIWFSIS